MEENYEVLTVDSKPTISILERYGDNLVDKNYITVDHPKSFRRKIYVRSEFLTK